VENIWHDLISKLRLASSSMLTFCSIARPIEVTQHSWPIGEAVLWPPHRSGNFTGVKWIETTPEALSFSSVKPSYSCLLCHPRIAPDVKLLRTRRLGLVLFRAGPGRFECESCLYLTSEILPPLKGAFERNIGQDQRKLRKLRWLSDTQQTAPSRNK
jgi:hypothetical protein